MWEAGIIYIYMCVCVYIKTVCIYVYIYGIKKACTRRLMPKTLHGTLLRYLGSSA